MWVVLERVGYCWNPPPCSAISILSSCSARGGAGAGRGVGNAAKQHGRTGRATQEQGGPAGKAPEVPAAHARPACTTRCDAHHGSAKSHSSAGPRGKNCFPRPAPRMHCARGGPGRPSLAHRPPRPLWRGAHNCVVHTTHRLRGRSNAVHVDDHARKQAAARLHAHLLELLLQLGALVRHVLGEGAPMVLRLLAALAALLRAEGGAERWAGVNRTPRPAHPQAPRPGIGPETHRLDLPLPPQVRAHQPGSWTQAARAKALAPPFHIALELGRQAAPPGLPRRRPPLQLALSRNDTPRPPLPRSISGAVGTAGGLSTHATKPRVSGHTGIVDTCETRLVGRWQAIFFAATC